MGRQVWRGEPGTGPTLSESRWGHSQQALRLADAGLQALKLSGDDGARIWPVPESPGGLAIQVAQRPLPHPVSDPVGLGCRTCSQVMLSCLCRAILGKHFLKHHPASGQLARLWLSHH